VKVAQGAAELRLEGGAGEEVWLGITEAEGVWKWEAWREGVQFAGTEAGLELTWRDAYRRAMRAAERLQGRGRGKA
jgi:hypothetical protein